MAFLLHTHNNLLNPRCFFKLSPFIFQLSMFGGWNINIFVRNGFGGKGSGRDVNTNFAWTFFEKQQINTLST